MASSNLYGRPQQIPGHGTITLERRAQLAEFHCTHCGKDKKSKNVAVWERPAQADADVCNGCFGEVLANGPRA